MAALSFIPLLKTLLKELAEMNGAEYLLFILMLAVFLGFELINKVPATLHTPLMSGANAISGITVVGAIAIAGNGNQDLAQWLGAGAVALASINVVGGYMVTDRMLGFFKKKEG
jgi:NAD(P) transhydrogenase subunit alpha